MATLYFFKLKLKYGDTCQNLVLKMKINPQANQ
jgi:hypothetical protein